MVAQRTSVAVMSARDTFWRVQALRETGRAFLMAGMISLGGVAACAQEATTDSQVEANVLKALAGAPDLASQSIQTNTVYGVVTLSGTVATEAARVEAENLAAGASGVRKVVDRLQVGDTQAAQETQGAPPAGMVLQSDGTYAPAAQAGQPAQSNNAAPGSAPAGGAVMNDPQNDPGVQTAGTGTQQQPYGQQSATGRYPQYGNHEASQPAYGQPQGQYPAYGQQGQYAQAGPQGGYPPNGYAQQPGYAPAGNPNGQPWGGQPAGVAVTVPAGTLIRARLNRLIASDRVHPGDHFDGVVVNDVVAGGFVAIPRGAQVQGTVVDAKPSGAISGRGELSIQLTSVTLSGRVYPLTSDVWTQQGPDKTGHTVGNTVGLGAFGAVLGAVVGRGAGAAIGGAAGAAAGVGVSAAEPKGQVVIPPEGLVSFTVAQPATLQTVSEQEMQRLAYGVPQGERRPVYGRPYPGYYPPPPPGYAPGY